MKVVEDYPNIDGYQEFVLRPGDVLTLTRRGLFGRIKNIVVVRAVEKHENSA